MPNTTAELNAEIEKQKAVFNVAKARLAALLGPAMPAPDAVNIFLAYAEEYTTDIALADCQSKHSHFNLAIAPHAGLAAKLAEPLEAANAAHQAVIDLVAERERLALEKDPAHKPTYFWDGREFTIDPEMQTYTDLDTGLTHAFVHDEQPPPRAPSNGKSFSR